MTYYLNIYCTAHAMNEEDLKLMLRKLTDIEIVQEVVNEYPSAAAELVEIYEDAANLRHDLGYPK